jgi:hypothetical protein
MQASNASSFIQLWSNCFQLIEMVDRIDKRVRLLNILCDYMSILKIEGRYDAK